MFVVTLCLAPASALTETRVALELVLAVDSSTSVNAREYELQVAGYAKAFRDKDVIAAISALGSSGMAVTYVKWSSHRYQVQSVSWTHVVDGSSSRAFADQIMKNSGRIEGSSTAIGDAVIYSVGLFKDSGFNGARRVVDVSADDRYNAGSAPSYARGIAQRNRVTVNGLAIDGTGILSDYFRDNVIAGDGAFVITAQSFEDFAAALKIKLLRELSGPDRLAGSQVSQ